MWQKKVWTYFRAVKNWFNFFKSRLYSKQHSFWSMLDLDLKNVVNPFKTWTWPSSQSRVFCREKPINQNSQGQVFKGLTPCLGQDQAWSELQLVKFIQWTEFSKHRGWALKVELFDFSQQELLYKKISILESTEKKS